VIRQAIDRLVLKHTDTCNWCRDDLGDEELVLIESGQVKSMKKDPSCLVFSADWILPIELQPEFTVVFAGHFGCFHSIMNRLNLGWGDRVNDHRCSSCDHHFSTDRWAFRCSIGGISRDQDFDIDIEIPRKVVMCAACMAKVFGRGNKNVGDKRLYEHAQRR
jgi:hypothetical protein